MPGIAHVVSKSVELLFNKHSPPLPLVHGEANIRFEIHIDNFYLV